MLGPVTHLKRTSTRRPADCDRVSNWPSVWLDQWHPGRRNLSCHRRAQRGASSGFHCACDRPDCRAALPATRRTVPTAFLLRHGTSGMRDWRCRFADPGPFSPAKHRRTVVRNAALADCGGCGIERFQPLRGIIKGTEPFKAGATPVRTGVPEASFGSRSNFMVKDIGKNEGNVLRRHAPPSGCLMPRV